MDENYLDNLLKEVSGEGSANFDKIVENDSSVDIDLSDLDTISLDELDNLDSLELGDLDIDDIDFDDVDVTKIDSNTTKTVSENQSEDDSKDFNLDKLISVLEEEDKKDESNILQENASVFIQEESVFNDAEELYSQDIEEPVNTETQVSDAESVKNMDLDDLFSALGINNDQDVQDESFTTNQESFEQLFQSSTLEGDIDDELANLFDSDSDISGSSASKNDKKRLPKVKKSVTEILFGEPDEEDKEEEELYKLKKAEKQVKKEQKKADKEVKNAEKKEKLTLKKQQKSKTKQEKAEKIKAINDEYDAELAKEKTVSTPVAILIFLGFAIVGFIVVLGARAFDYAQVIKKASDYFERQRYRLAYDEVSGVEVKEDDEQLRDRIYTVMYVENLYESYENNIALNRYDKALDSLLRGLENYDEHYEDAVKLRIAKDIKLCKEKIVNALWNTYGISEKRAYEIIELTGDEYLQVLYECCEKYNIGE